MDCHMPTMDGYEATRCIRKLEVGKQRLPIIAFTASAYDQDRIDCKDAGMDDFISKPVKIEKLREILKQWII